MCIFHPADPQKGQPGFAFFAQGSMSISRVGDDAHIVPQPRYSSGPVKPNHPTTRVGDDAHIVL